jgi:hypothetical protein
MDVRREGKNGPSPWDELSPGLREAVEGVLHDSLPEPVRLRALDALHRQVVRYPRRGASARSRILSTAATAIAASIVWTALAACMWTAVGSVKLPAPTDTAALSNEVPTAWTYSRAARQSPEALNTLLDRRARPTNPAGSRLLAGAHLPPLIPVNQTAP